MTYPSKTLSRAARTALVVPLALGFGATAQAITFSAATTPEGFVSGLSGASEFGLPDSTPGSITCPLCDSVVNFATFSNADGSDWTEDLGLNPTFVGPFADINARWVFFYQVQNTDPLDVANADLENFNVTTMRKNGLSVEENAYSSGGFIDDSALDPFNAQPGIDTPKDHEASEIGVAKSIVAGADNIAPTDLSFTDASGPNPIASAAVHAGQEAYAGALFQFDDPNLGPFDFSEVLFLTSNADHAGLVWAETESPGGFGAAGDIAGIKVGAVPVPASFLLLAPALLGLGLLGRRRAA